MRQHKKLAYRRIVFLSRIKAREDANRSSIHSLEQTPKDKKMTSFFAEIYSLIRFEKDGTESSAGGTNLFDRSPVLHLARVMPKYVHFSITLIEMIRFNL